MSAKVKYSIIIPAHNEEKYIAGCLESIIKYVPLSQVEVIVVDNASTDKTSQVVKTYSQVKLVQEPHKGLTRARQAGFKASQGEILCYLDADSRVYPEWFPIIQNELATDPKVVCISGPYKYYDLPAYKQKMVSFYQNVMAIQASKVTKGLVMGASFAAKRDALIKAGGFDTTIEFYGEDADIGFRLSKIGKVKFLKHFFIYTSARRLHKEGMFKIGSRYAVNYIWQATFKKPFTKDYVDIR